VPGDRSPGTGERPFRLTENSAQRAITNHLLGERAVGMAEVGELLSAA
jgi:acyl-CoA dehydrogenase